jgi:hypothetical protein
MKLIIILRMLEVSHISRTIAIKPDEKTNTDSAWALFVCRFEEVGWTVNSQRHPGAVRERRSEPLSDPVCFEFEEFSRQDEKHREEGKFRFIFVGSFIRRV